MNREIENTIDRDNNYVMENIELKRRLIYEEIQRIDLTRGALIKELEGLIDG